MKPKRIMLQAMTTLDRHVATGCIQDAISHSEGWVEDARLYSNKMTTISLVVSAGKFDNLLGQIEAAGIDVEPVPGHGRGDIGKVADNETELNVSIQLSFIHDQPDLKQEIPAVPG